jgi:hypothetical protein
LTEIGGHGKKMCLGRKGSVGNLDALVEPGTKYKSDDILRKQKA